MTRAAPGPGVVASAAALGGILLACAFAPAEWWIAAIPAVGLVAGATARGGRAAVGGGMLFGAAFWFPVLGWLSAYLGPVPWAALAAFMTAWTVLAVWTAALAARWTEAFVRGRSGRGRRDGRLPDGGGTPGGAGGVLPAAAWAVTFVAWESVSSRIPWGGFSWGRLAVSQADSPLAHIASWLGIPAVSLAVALLGAIPAFDWMGGAGGMQLRLGSTAVPGPTPGKRFRPSPVPETAYTPRLVFQSRVFQSRVPRPGFRWHVPSPAAVVAWSLVAALATAPAWGALAAPTGTLRVAAVQGDAQAGLFANTQPGDILDDQLAAARGVAGRHFDLMVWPENSVNLDLNAHPEVQRRLQRFVNGMGAPLVFGTLLSDSHGRLFNSIVVMEPQTAIGGGITQRYDKRHPVPFAEYMPSRSFFHALAPGLVDLLPRDFTPGTRSGVLTVAGTRTGTLVCFEVTSDDLSRALVDQGAEVILAPTNNSDFGRTQESAQQLQSARLQAIATGRAVVNISTVASSALISPSGSLGHRLPDFAPAAFVADVPLQTRRTPAHAIGPIFEGIVMGLGAGLIAAALDQAAITRSRSWRSRRRDAAYRAGSRSVR